MRWDLLLPDISRAAQLFMEYPEHFLYHWWSTFSVSLVASFSALLVSIFAAILAVRFRLFDVILIPVVSLSQSFPLQAAAPLLLIMMGVGIHTKITIAFIIAFFPIYGTILAALRSTPTPLTAYLRVCRSPFIKGIFYVRFPAALPAIAAASKVGFTLAVLGAVVAEFIQPDRGLGYLILVAQSNYDVDVIYLCICMLMIQGGIIYSILSYCERVSIARRGV